MVLRMHESNWDMLGSLFWSDFIWPGYRNSKSKTCPLYPHLSTVKITTAPHVEHLTLVHAMLFSARFVWIHKVPSVHAMIVLALALQLKHHPLQSGSLAINMQDMLDMSWVDSALNGDRWHDHVVKQSRFPGIGFPTSSFGHNKVPTQTPTHHSVMLNQHEQATLQSEGWEHEVTWSRVSV